MVDRIKNLRVKTFIEDSAEKIDRKIDDFRKDNIIQATQTHIFGNPPIFGYVVFYIGKEEYNVASFKKCPKCGKDIPKIYSSHTCGWKQ